MNYSEITQVDDSTKEIEKLPLLMHRVQHISNSNTSYIDRILL
jgi:hypothetical protein